jgi:FkbM family methyltransferase
MISVSKTSQKMNEARLKEIHQNMKIDYGSLSDEYVEQLMSTTYLTGDEKVLELGGNIGRNSLIIGYILNQHNNTNFVTMETNTEDAQKLEHNRDLNGLKFHVENAALSARPLIQRGWHSIPSSEVVDEYFRVNTMTWKELNDKYNIEFDTLVLDCEGAFYYILEDTPEILDNIKLIIIENDYWRHRKESDTYEYLFDRKTYMDNLLSQNNFYLDYEHDLDETRKGFWAVWKKRV